MSTAQHSTAPDTALLSHPGRPHKTPIAYINEAVHYNPNMGAINQPNIFSNMRVLEKEHRTPEHTRNRTAGAFDRGGVMH